MVNMGVQNRTTMCYIKDLFAIASRTKSCPIFVEILYVESWDPFPYGSVNINTFHQVDCEVMMSSTFIMPNKLF